MTEVLNKMLEGESINAETMSWSYEELCETNFKLILPAEYFQYDAITGGYTDMSATATGMDYLYNGKDVGTVLKVVGIARPNEEASSGMVTGAIGYTGALTEYAIRETEKMEIVRQQMENKTQDIFLNLPFRTEDYAEPSAQQKTPAIGCTMAGVVILFPYQSQFCRRGSR